VTDAVFMPNLNHVAVALTAGYIIFYDMTANFLTPILTIVDLEICVTCMDYAVSERETSRSVLLWGDARGNISGIRFQGCQNICFFSNTSKSFKSVVSFKDLLKHNATGKYCGVFAYKLHHIHHDFVLKIRYLPNYDSFLSCSRNYPTAMFLGDLEGKRAAFFRVQGGVYDFDYSRKNNTIVTGGKDCIVRAWNPYVTIKPVMIIQGHKTPGQSPICRHLDIFQSPHTAALISA
jgi:WD40 repeat protein